MSLRLETCFVVSLAGRLLGDRARSSGDEIDDRSGPVRWKVMTVPDAVIVVTAVIELCGVQ